MEGRYLENMIERFFNAELSAEEERALCRYLQENEIPDELHEEKECILALCNAETEVPPMIPGADERLETMLDRLEEEHSATIIEKVWL